MYFFKIEISLSEYPNFDIVYSVYVAVGDSNFFWVEDFLDAESANSFVRWLDAKVN